MVNYITLLLLCVHNRRTYYHVAVVVNRLMKIRHFIPIETLLVEELTTGFIKRVYSLYKCPNTIVLD